MKLRIKILLALIISLVIGYFSFFIIYLLFQPLQLKYTQEITIYNCFTFAYIAICICISLLLFYLFIGKRINYISYLSQQVVTSPDKIEIKGNDEISVLAKTVKEMFLKNEISYANERRLEQEKYNLITSLSHDIRTPLTAIIGYLELIKNDIKENEHIEIAYNRSKQLSVLVNKLFDYVKIADTEYKINPIDFDIVLLLKQLLIEYKHQFDQLNIRINALFPEKTYNIVADPNSMFRTFDNLFQNSLKYACTYLRINIEENSNYLIIKLENDTNKIFDINRISERFYKGDSKNTDSSGLGLYISRVLVEKNGGKMEFYADKNKFIIKILLNTKTQNS